MNQRMQAEGRIMSDAVLDAVRESIVVKVLRTFELRPMRDGGYTEKELQQRNDLAVEIWNHLYGECRWSKERALDHLLPFMVQCIDGARISDLDAKAGARDGSEMYTPERLNDIEAERRLSALATTRDNVRETPSDGATGGSNGNQGS
jgi:hypothetical protein